MTLRLGEYTLGMMYTCGNIRLGDAPEWCLYKEGGNPLKTQIDI